MENNPRKSKAFIITFILILLVLVAGYLLFRNRDSLFGTKGESSLSKIFSPLLGTSKNKNVTVIEEPAPTTPNETNTSIITDVNGNKLVLAQAGENIQKGDVLYIAGFNESKQPIVMKAIANDPKKSLVFGVAAEDIKMGSLGNILIEGILIDIDTDRKEITNWAVNNPLYLSDKIYGGMTKNPPVSPSFVIPVGSVLKVHEINGSIRIGNITGNENINGDQITNWKKFNSKFLYDSMKDIQDYWDSIFDDYPYSDEYDDDNDFPFTPIQKPSGSSGSSSGSGSGNNDNGGTNDDGSDDDGDEGDDTDDNSKNICLNIEQNPLTFTDSEQKELDEILRKYYLIATTLKSENDIALAYAEIAEYKAFVEQIKGLTNQCYNQLSNPSYTGPKTQYGNPWYKYTERGSYLTSPIYSYCRYVNNSNDTTGNNSTIPFCEPSVGPDGDTRKETLNYWGIPAFYSPLDLREFESVLNIW